jgi:hypothetical protein
MAFILSGLLNWLRGLFFAKHLEVTIVGLQVSGRWAVGDLSGSVRCEAVREPCGAVWSDVRLRRYSAMAYGDWIWGRTRMFGRSRRVSGIGNTVVWALSLTIS